MHQLGKGVEPSIFTREGQPTELRCDLVCGEGVREGAMALAPLSAGFQSLPLLPTIKVDPSGAASQCVDLCMLWDPVGLSNELSCGAGSFPTAVSTPTGVLSQWFEALFPQAGTLGCAVCSQVYQLLPCQPAAALPTPLPAPQSATSLVLPAAALPCVLSAPAAHLCPSCWSG